MEFQMLGHPPGAPRLDLDHRRFAYAGKFVSPRCGKTVVRDDAEIVGATAFNADHTTDETGRIRYVTVREDRQAEGIGPRLLRFTAARLVELYDAVVIAVNSPIAYEACYRGGFVTMETESGMAELRLRYAPDAERSVERYRRGFSAFEGRDLPETHESVLRERRTETVPPVVDVPGEVG